MGGLGDEVPWASCDQPVMVPRSSFWADFMKSVHRPRIPIASKQSEIRKIYPGPATRTLPLKPTQLAIKFLTPIALACGCNSRRR